MVRFLKIVVYCTSVLFILTLAGAGVALYAFWYYGQQLPDHTQLANYQPKMTSRIHAGDGRLIAEFANEKRAFVPVSAIPRHIVQAFIAAEDQRFYDHKGVDPVALARAVITNIMNIGSGKRPVGASTITQQVAKNFLIGNEVSYERKAKEAIIAIRMEKAFDKNDILELYMNEIYLGVGSYGVAAAALSYFNKSLDELTVAEAAYLAALPKAPANYHPTRRPVAAKDRRDWVIGRMLAEGFIDAPTASAAWAEPFAAKTSGVLDFAEADYFVEEVRRELQTRYGDDELYEGGLSVRTTVDTRLQEIADAALRNGLVEYDRRHGWRGPIMTLEAGADWKAWLEEAALPDGARGWWLAVVLKLDDKSATIGLKSGVKGVIPMSELHWARQPMEDQEVGPPVKTPAAVLSVGNVVLVETVSETQPDKDGKTEAYPDGTYTLRQIPEVNGAILALDPHTGRILAMSGGYDFRLSEFNRATQAWRQPGSAFKPFVYLTALDNGFTPSTMILDAPFVLDQGPEKGKWKPENYSTRFYGEAPMRLGIEKSRNLMTVRLAKAVGMRPIAANAVLFNIVDHMPPELAMALGSGETTLLRLVAAYGMLANGGKRITPSLIDRVQDRDGKTVFRHDTRPCEGCSVAAWDMQPAPVLPDEREIVSDPISTYQIVSMLQGVVQRGTGARVRSVGRPLAGKTGTTNESQDAWFIGFSPDLVAGVFVGFDTPRTLGRRETGSSAAVPIFKEFIISALAKRRARPFRTPPGIKMVRMSMETGLPARPGDDPRKVILEAFRAGTEPRRDSRRVVIDGSESSGSGPASSGSGSSRGEPWKPRKQSTDTGLY
jgi:penicillin-binding protein 1A